MPLFHILIVRSHLVTVSVLLRRLVLVNLGLCSVSLPSTRSSTRTRQTTAAAGVILLCVMTFTSSLGRSSSCALTD